MNREALKDAARAAIVRQAPGLGVAIVEQLLNAPVFQRWMTSIEKRRPHGIVAFVRRLRGQNHGMSEEQADELERVVEKTLEKYL